MKVNIKNKEYEIRDINSINLSDYSALQDYIKTEPDDMELSRNLLILFTDIPEEIVNDLDESILQIDWLTQITKPLSIVKLKPEYLDKSVIDLDNMKVGQFVDLEYMLTNHTGHEQILNVCAMLLTQGEETMKDYENVREQISLNLPVRDIITLFNHYVNWKSALVKSYDGLFSGDVPEPDEDATEELPEPDEGLSHWGWLGAVYQLADNDLLKVDKILDQDLTSFLNFISYQKEVYDHKNKRA